MDIKPEMDNQKSIILNPKTLNDKGVDSKYTYRSV